MALQFISFAAVVVYFTYNDQPSGVYSSQVCDVVEFLSKHCDEKVKLVAFISLRGFGNSRRKIKAQCPGALVVPMFPKMKNWKLNILMIWLILFFLRPRVVMARGVFASALVLRARKALHHFKMVFDARGAYHAEFSEYQPGGWPGIAEGVRELEKNALNQSDAQLAVSKALIDYWQERYDIDKTATASIIPCTLSSAANGSLPSHSERTTLRTKHGFTPEDVIIVYSGSSAGWQSFAQLYQWLVQMLHNQPAIKVMLMTPLDSLEDTPLKEFSSRILLKWVAPSEVSAYLAMCDYGLLLREASDTNRVASPTKFAEYLAAGLKVLISPQIGDFSDFVDRENCGLVVGKGDYPGLSPLSENEQRESAGLAKKYFIKERYLEQYLKLIGNN